MDVEHVYLILPCVQLLNYSFVVKIKKRISVSISISSMLITLQNYVRFMLSWRNAAK